ncbi:hypothetical protein DFJ74DRAFT_712174 [Hyaloraphidium curvatum]|nr:hypothetical protein DFJ74DRAFT_712174 [Hyaloraphidium curvatum]
MAGVPKEFTAAHVAANSRPGDLYTPFLLSGEPFRSAMRRDFHLGARQGVGIAPEDLAANAGKPAPGLDLEDDTLFYNTSKAKEYWKDKDLPRPTKDIHRLRDDLKKWGYCLVEDALSKEQCAHFRRRVLDQADGERLAGVACYNGSPVPPGAAVPNTQLVHCLINKGERFAAVLDHDPAAVQAGPLIEQLVSDTIGADFLCSSFIAIIAGTNNIPQQPHQDQACAPLQVREAPLTCNTMFLLDEFRADNGGTLLIPGSHLLLSKSLSIDQPLPPAINLEAPAGTACVFEGRLLHGAGINRTAERRAMMVTNSLKPWMRQQEVHLLSTARDVLERAGPKLLYRLGFRPTTALGGVEGNWRGEYQVWQRAAMEGGRFRPIRELGPGSKPEELAADYNYRHSELGAKLAPHQDGAVDEVRERYRGIRPAFLPPASKL